MVRVPETMKSNSRQSQTRVRRVRADRHRSYEVHLVDGLLGERLTELADRIQGRKSLLVTTPTVAKLYGESIHAKLADSVDVSLFVLPAKEKSKHMDHAMAICREAHGLGFGRKSVLIGLGGGVCTDLVTMAASLLRRGTPYMRIPTTLLGQVDGSIGVKGAVNFNDKKNSLGCYYSPEAVFVDPAFLQTLSRSQISHGLAEIIKMALVRDARLFDLLEEFAKELLDSRFQAPRQPATEILSRAIMGMIEELESNIYEDQTYRRLVDFGHTVSPQIESASQFQMSHGDAVAMGIAFCCELARDIGLMTAESCERAITCIRTSELPTSSELLTKERVLQAFDEATRHRDGALNLVVPTEIGRATFIESKNEISDESLDRVVSKVGFGTDPPTLKNNSSQPCLVFDIGGTNLRAAIYDESTGRLTRRGSRPTPNHRRNPELKYDDILRLLLGDIEDLATELLDRIPPQSISVAFAGPLNERNEVVAAPTVWGKTQAKPIDLLSDLRCLWPSTTINLMNDVTAAGYRYLKTSDESLCMVTVGSGIGNKIFVNGKPFTGPSGRGGEMGHIVVDQSPNAIQCDCGGKGHLGGIASGRGTLATARQRAAQDSVGFSQSALGTASGNRIEAITNEHIVSQFHAGDGWTLQLIDYVAGKLGNVLAQVHQSLGIERFVIFGGFATALGEAYRQSLVRAAAADCWDSGQMWNEMIELGLDDDDSGLLGAGRFATEFAEAT